MSEPSNSKAPPFSTLSSGIRSVNSLEVPGRFRLPDIRVWGLESNSKKDGGKWGNKDSVYTNRKHRSTYLPATG